MRTVTQTLQWAAALIVVRLLTPADYGLIAMATAYLGLVQTFSEFGLGAAIVQRQNLSEGQIAQLGGVSLSVSTVFALLSVAVSGLVASFFQEPRVRLIIIVMSVTFVFSGADVVARSLLRRDLEFKRLAWVQASQNLTYAVVSLTLAALGFGYWSLVLAALVGMLVRTLFAIVSKPHRISLPRRLHMISSELRFGWHVVVSQFAFYVRRFADVVIVGRLLGTEAVGAYNVGWTQANLPVDRGTAIVNEVSPSVLAAVQDDHDALRRYFRIFTQGIALLAFPATFGVAVVADDFVMLVFGETWTATIGPLRVLALVAAMRAITPILSQVLVATDQAEKNMHFALVAAVIMPVFFVVGSRWGITGVAVGWLAGHPVVVGTVLLPRALRTAHMSFGQYVAALRPALLASAAMVSGVVLVRSYMPDSWVLPVRFAVEVLTGAGLYGVIVLTVYGRRVRSLLSLVRSTP